jgi:serine/threonine protein kinase
MRRHDIASDLLSCNNCDHNNNNDGHRHKIGWEVTKGNSVSQEVATQVKRVVEQRTKTIVETSAYDKLLRSADNSNNNNATTNVVDFWNHTQIELGDLLGEGGFNQVYKINSSPSGCNRTSQRKDEYVVKVLRKEVIQNEVEFALCAADIIKEAILMAALDHPHILKTRAVAAAGISGFEDTCRPDAFFMVMGKLDESLEDRVFDQWRSKASRCRLRPRRRSRFLTTRLKVATPLADALAYMHSFQILHRDLKPTNIGFDATGSLKVFDFDLARLIPESNTPDDDERFALTKKAGTLRYMSPECGKGEPYNLKSDVYSFSLLLHQIISLKQPYQKINGAQQELKVFHQGMRPKISSSWPTMINDLMHRGWSEDILTRPSMQEMLVTLEQEVQSRELNSIAGA